MPILPTFRLLCKRLSACRGWLPGAILLGLLLAARPGASQPTPARPAPTAPNRLEEFLAAAYQHSPLLGDWRGQVLQNQLDSLRRAAQNRPYVAGNAVAVYAPVSRRFGYDEAVSNGGNYGTVASISQPLLNGNVLRNDYRLLENQGQTLRNNGRLSALDLRRSLTDQFLTAYAAEQQWAFSREILAQLRRQDVLLRRLVNGGLYKQTQYLSYYLSVRTQEVTVQQNRLAYRRELGTLRYLCGVRDTALRPLQTPVPPTHAPLAGLHSITQRQYTLDSLRLRLQHRAIALSYRPRVQAVADIGLQSASLLAIQRRFGISGGLQLSVPIFDGHQRQLASSRLEVAEQIRHGYRSFLSAQRQQLYDQLQNQLQATTELLGLLREQLRVAEALVAAGHQQLATGDISILDYLQLLGSTRNFGFSLTQTETDRLRVLYQLDYLSE